MSTETTLRIESISSIATEQIGERIGKKLRGGEVIVLSSDLGGGKTTFVRGLARGIASPDAVASPSFTISRVYRAQKTDARTQESRDLWLYHFDFYRLHDAGHVAHELQDVLNDPHNVVVIEWAGVVQHALPEKRLNISITKFSQTGREVHIHYPPELGYLVTGLGKAN